MEIEREDLTLNEIIAKIFLLCLPLRMLSFIYPISSIFGMQAESLSSIFLIIGLFFSVLSNNGIPYSCSVEQNRLFNYYWKVVILAGITSLLMAVYVSFTYGYYNNSNSPYGAVLKIILNFIQYGLVFWYSREIFRTLSVKEIIRCILISTRICLVVGYLQIFVLKSVPMITPLYNYLAEIFMWGKFNQQIALTFYEPSWAAMFIGVIVIPLHMSNILKNDSKKAKSVIELLIWLPVIVMTKSTTAYLMAFAALSSGLLYVIFSQKSSIYGKILSVIFIIVGILFIENLDYFDSLLGFKFSYLVSEKATDLGNMSTVARSIPLIGNWEIFKEFPLLGCGNGLQGYFFPDLIPNDYYRVLYLDKATTLMLSGHSKSIPNGQLFFPGILSGYGIVGTGLFAMFFYNCIDLLRKNFNGYGRLGIMYMLALIPIFLSGIKSEFVGILYIWFILSIPFSFQTDESNIKEVTANGEVE